MAAQGAGDKVLFYNFTEPAGLPRVVCGGGLLTATNRAQ
jgi:hypothetical protein